MEFFKKNLAVFGIIFPMVFFVVFLINYNVNSASRPYIFSETENAPKTEVALILGAKVYNDGRLSDMLKDRADTAINLYESGKVNKILVSGDHEKEEYDEVNAVKNYLLEKGVKCEDIFLDHAGFDTYDSLYRAKEIFEARSVAIVSQNFHLPRAVYIGRGLGLETYGASADLHTYGNIESNITREFFANVKAFWDVNLSVKPKFLGEPIPLSGDSKKSWD
ncbi:YdcF family protein [Patescibacteria group bacterium]|nr:YdcF family protein [Patescibacteria group bacterium]